MDRRQRNPMLHAEDITIFNTFIQKQRLFQFLAGINETFEKEKRDLLNQDPLPTVEVAYATIRCEISRRGIMTHASSPGKISPQKSRVGWPLNTGRIFHPGVIWRTRLTSNVVTVEETVTQRKGV